MVGLVNDLHEVDIPERGRHSNGASSEQNSSDFKTKEWILIE
jgi:hypothetical protein